VGEDTRFVLTARDARIGVLENNRFFVSRIHEGNTSRKYTNSGRFREVPFEVVRGIVGVDWPAVFGELGSNSTLALPSAGTALVSAASGIGDILRVTPLIRVLSTIGYTVDLLLWPDDPATIDLLRDAPELRHVIAISAPGRDLGEGPLASFEDQDYDLATFTHLSARLSRFVRARTRYSSDANWRSEGDNTCLEKIARAVGWQGPLPAPFAMKSARSFNLPPGTIAIHPGCKPNWPWKKWHGFDELASLFPNVAIVGTDADLDNSQTYFNRPFAWPGHVRNFVGQLGLRDTAALISQCAALISLDSGIMHLGVALEIPTFGIFGITSPERECMRSPFMIPITKQPPCEPACRRAAWGRRDCEHHLECLRTLTAEGVAATVMTSLPEGSKDLTRWSKPAKRSETISLNYYGEVFQASGYGQAARAYVHALHAAGVQVHVVNATRGPHHLEDTLISAQLGCDPGADFNLFHGIPSFWARSAYAQRNVIAMTVWEADRMPPVWRDPLSHAIDVWLPCAFNVEVFARDLTKTPFCLPHALLPDNGIAEGHPSNISLAVEPADFVFYSIFEWQDRKNPRGLIEAFFETFAGECDAVLLIKTNAGAATEAQRAVDEVRALTRSRARVVLHCDTFDEAVMRALHARGDCYVSLHRGEGWGYPLFEAAARGTPVVATAYGGPLDYLDPRHHWLVRHTLTPVRQQYFLYRPFMNWAEPDAASARDGLRWVYEHRAESRARAQEAARELRMRFAPQRIGEAAKARLVELKRRIPMRSATSVTQAQPTRALATPVAARRPQPDRAPALPIPGAWYDADYFERGLKSNWKGGYSWPSFQGLFTEAAALLEELFPDARSYVDAGCAKGFLVQALRERGRDARGFDHSEWAITHAQPSAKPFIELAPLEAVAYDDSTVDVLIAMSLFESLTEDQIRYFLPRARQWVRHTLFATIPIQRAGSDRDLSHIMMRDRQWWYDRFVEAGWRQDPRQEAIRRHPFVKKMNWDVYLFEPGR
jgi:glycosyltransferase involved in cell wall biosynthesis